MSMSTRSLATRSSINAGTLAYYGALEASGADVGAHSCWQFGAIDECFNGTLAGLLTENAFQPRSVWWLHKSYSDGVGHRVKAATSNPDIVALASNAITGGNTSGPQKFRRMLSGLLFQPIIVMQSTKDRL